MESPKVLIITYYWPPGGGAGVQRWLKFTKYLPSFGWTPVIYTPSNGEMPVIDESLSKDIPPGTTVLKTPIREPYGVYKRFVGAGRNEKINTGFLTEKKRPGLMEKISVWIRGNVFIPDARCFWIKPSVKYLTRYLTENPVDLIVSTGPPHSMHLIAKDVSKALQLPWIADFRDPWTNIDYYKDLMLTKAADKKHHEMERAVVTEATKVVVVSGGMKHEFESRYNRNIDVITNGYDEDDILPPPAGRPQSFVLSHIGTLVKSRNPAALWKALAELVAADKTFEAHLEIRLTGKTDVSVKESIEKYGLAEFVTYVDYLPHALVTAEHQKASLLLLLLNDTPNARGILTGKLFEYMASRRPVLCVGPVDGDAASILEETHSGITCGFGDVTAIRRAIADSFGAFLRGDTVLPSANIQKYSRKSLTGVLAEVMNAAVSLKN